MIRFNLFTGHTVSADVAFLYPIDRFPYIYILDLATFRPPDIMTIKEAVA